MALIYITGISGSGKSEILKELKARGYKAYGTDEDGVSAFYDNETNELLENPPTKANDRTPEWRARYTWKMSRQRVEELAREAQNKNVFLCGVAANENEVWDLFSKTLALVIDEETLRHRIATRTSNNFGQVPHELESILEWQESANDNYRKFGVTMIDATQSVDKVVDNVLAEAKNI
jgi:thymidylate kinase